MKIFFTQHRLLIIAFSLPLLLIVGVALSSVLPSRMLTSQYDFIYATCVDGSYQFNYRCNQYLESRYVMFNGKLTINDSAVYPDLNHGGVVGEHEGYTARLFLHDTDRNVSREITEAEALSLTLSELITSPDGVSVSGGYESGVDFLIFYSGGSSYDFYLTKGGTRRKLNLINPYRESYYNDNFEFIGWVMPGRN